MCAQPDGIYEVAAYNTFDNKKKGLQEAQSAAIPKLHDVLIHETRLSHSRFVLQKAMEERVFRRKGMHPPRAGADDVAHCPRWKP